MAASDTNGPEGIDAGEVTAWFRANVPDVAPPLQFSLIAGGRSNLTYEVRDAGGGHWVLRRPPLGHVLATAHDMSREHRIISALAPTDVPVPPAIGLSADDSVNGAPFYVMRFVDGTVLRDREQAEAVYDEAQRRTISESLVDVLARIHAVDVDAVGLGDLGRREGYIERQLKRWYEQFQKSKLRDIPAVDRVHDALLTQVPPQGPATIVHGDYRLDNTLLGADGHVLAVLDWEICTLGDPLADVGLLGVYWADPGDELAVLGVAPTAADGFLRRDDLFERYASVSGRDLSDIAFYQAFGFWKLACILEGVHARYVAGAMGEDAEAAGALFADVVIQLADQAEKRLGDLS